MTNDIIILLEFQNQWTRPGLFNRLIGAELKRQNAIENTVRLTKAARQNDIPIIHAPLLVDPANLKGLYAHLTRGLFFAKDTKRGEIDDRVLADTDIIVQGRTAFDAFTDSTLEEKLKPFSDRRMLFAGFATDQCVLKSLNTAVGLGYDAFLISDCSATFLKTIQKRTERKLGSRVVTSAQLIGEWNAQ